MADTELKPCPWCGVATDKEDAWGSLITHKDTCYWRNIHGDPIGRVRVNNSDKERWNTRAGAPTVVDARGAAEEVAKYIDVVARDWHTNQDDVDEIKAIILRHVSGGEGEK